MLRHVESGKGFEVPPTTRRGKKKQEGPEESATDPGEPGPGSGPETEGRKSIKEEVGENETTEGLLRWYLCQRTRESH